MSAAPVDRGGWRPVERLYFDPALLAGVVSGLAQRIATPHRLVAASTFFLGFAARLWSIGLGALAGHALLPDLAPAQLWYAESGGQLRLRLPRPTAWRGDDLAPDLADMVLDAHLEPLAIALRRLGPISEKLLRGNTASAVLGAGRVLDRQHGSDTPGPGWRLARLLCEDPRLADAVRFTADGYRRTSCCLYYRTPGGGLCGDCALTEIPRKTRTINRKESS